MLFLFAVLSASLILAMSDKSCPGVEFVSRAEWNAREPFRTDGVRLPLNHIVILHTVTQYCNSKPQCSRSMQFIQDMHLDERGWFDIAYNFVVGGDGRVYEGRGWHKAGAFSLGFNTKSLGVAFIGNYNKQFPTEAQINATLNLFKCGVDKAYLTPTREIHGHRDLACTESPGYNLYIEIRRWKGYKGGRMPDYQCVKLRPPVIDKDELDY